MGEHSNPDITDRNINGLFLGGIEGDIIYILVVFFFVNLLHLSISGQKDKLEAYCTGPHIQYDYDSLNNHIYLVLDLILPGDALFVTHDMGEVSHKDLFIEFPEKFLFFKVYGCIPRRKLKTWRGCRHCDDYKQCYEDGTGYDVTQSANGLCPDFVFVQNIFQPVRK